VPGPAATVVLKLPFISLTVDADPLSKSIVTFFIGLPSVSSTVPRTVVNSFFCVSSKKITFSSGIL